MFSAFAPPRRVFLRYDELWRSLCHWLLYQRSVPARVNVNPVFAAADDSRPANSSLSTVIWSAICWSVTFPLPAASIMTWT